MTMARVTTTLRVVRNRLGNRKKDRKGRAQGRELGQGSRRKQRKGRARDKGRGRGRETVKGKVLFNTPQGEVIYLLTLLSGCRNKWWRHTRTQRAN